MSRGLPPNEPMKLGSPYTVDSSSVGLREQLHLDGSLHIFSLTAGNTGALLPRAAARILTVDFLLRS